MTVEFIPADSVRDLGERLQVIRAEAITLAGSHDEDDPDYWVRLFEANAAALLARLTLVSLPPGHIVRYCFYGSHAGDLLVRPFVARATTDVSAVRRLVDWHPPPDSVAPSLASRPSKDVELLYSRFAFEHSAAGFFEYWVAMQELWASVRWIHSRVIAERQELDAISSRDGWNVDRPVLHCEPAVVRQDDGGAQIAVLLYCPLERAAISLHRVQIGADQEVVFVEAIPVAHGRSGYCLR